MLIICRVLEHKVGNVFPKDPVGIFVDVLVYWDWVVFFAVMKKKVEIFFGEYLKGEKKGGYDKKS